MKVAASLAVFALLPLRVHAAPPPTFAHDIAPIVYQYCASCHRPGEAGPFPLLSYIDVKKHARQIADVTRRRFIRHGFPSRATAIFRVSCG